MAVAMLASIYSMVYCLRKASANGLSAVLWAIAGYCLPILSIFLINGKLNKAKSV